MFHYIAQDNLFFIGALDGHGCGCVYNREQEGDEAPLIWVKMWALQGKNVGMDTSHKVKLDVIDRFNTHHAYDHMTVFISYH